ncbi:MAG: hypothetical protein KF690_10400, partial [Bacteroidetes bacterium]|nr:hypothetical protein [Bacteroidota bacterium]
MTTMLLLRPLLAAFLISLASCALLNRDLVQLEETNFTDEVDQTQNLVFEFNKDLAPGTLLNRWDTTRYIAFTPAIPGRFKWVGPRKLVFSPAQALQPATRYSGQLTPALLRHGEKDWKLDEEAPLISFATAPLELSQAEAYWALGANQAAEARLRLTFNYPVQPADLQKHLEVRAGGSVAEARVLTQETAAVMEVSVSGVPRREGESAPITLTLLSGLSCPGANQALVMPHTRVVYAPATASLAITNVYTQLSGTEGKIYVHTTQALRPGNLADYIRVRPYGDYRSDTTQTLALEVTPLPNGCLISGPFSPENTYEIMVRKGLPGVLGSTLLQDHRQQISFGVQGKAIDFVHHKGTYLGSNGQRNLAVRISNVDRVKVRIAKVYENNLISFLNTHKRWQYHYDEGTDAYHEYQYYDIERFGDVIEEQTWEADKLPGLNRARLLKLDFNDPRKEFDGIYVVEVCSEDEYWVRSSKIVTVSDVGLIVRHGRNQLMVFANSLNTAEPVADCQINVVSTNNQTFLRGKTDEHGICVFHHTEGFTPGFEPAMVTARKFKDFSYLLFSKSRIETSRFEVGGRTTRDRLYDAYLYAERELYRPGETLHLNTLVRSFQWEPVREMPVTVSIYFPDGKRFQQFQGELSPEGALETTCPIPVHAPTGKYNVVVTVAEDKVIGSKAIYVEEFMPDRIKVQLDIPRKDLGLSEPLVAEAVAGNFFGYPAAHRNYEAEVQLSRIPLTPKGLDRYDFAVATEANYPTMTDEGKTDAEGRVLLRFPLPAHYKYSGLLKGSLYLTVFDENGRPIHRMRDFRVFTQDVFMGIGKFERYAPTGKALQIPVVAVDIQERPKPGQRAVLQVLHAHWETVIERQHGSYRYVSKRNDQLLYERSFETGVDGTAGLDFIPPASGEYEVRVYLPEAKTYVSRSFYCYGWASSEEASFEVNNDGHVDIAMEKPAYGVGETANLVFKTPFEGKLIVTLEQDSVLQHHVLQTKDQAAYLPLRFSEVHLPSIFVSATLIRPMYADGNPFTVAHGYQRIAVNQPGRQLPVTLTAAASSRSRSRQEVVLHTAPGAEVTL